MTTFAIGLVRDEEDIIGATAAHMLTQVDHVMVLDNNSIDSTRTILLDLGVEVIPDPEPGYFQSQKMSALAARAARAGADIVVPFDADEFIYSPFGRIADVLNDHPEVAIFTADPYDHVPTAEDPATGDPLTRMGWRRRERTPLRKVACRPSLPVTIHQGNHGCDYGTLRTLDELLVVRHYPLRSVEQMIRKARNGGQAYAATTLPADIGAHWRQWNMLTDGQLADVFRTYYWSSDPREDESLIFDPAPRQ